MEIKTEEKTEETVRTYHDEDCPACGFPEQTLTRVLKTGEVLKAECSKGCGWEESY